MAYHVAEEHLLSVNSYQEPKVLYDNNAAYTLIIRLLLLEPGKDKDRPEMGVGLVSKYRYITTDKIDTLRTDLTNQIRTYLPDFSMVDVNIEAYGTTLALFVRTDDITYGIKFDSENGTVAPLTIDDIK